MIKKLRYKYCNKRTTTRDNDNAQYHDQEENRLNSVINRGAHALTDDKITRSPFNKNNVAVWPV